MPNQTTKTQYVAFPDGAKVEVSTDSGSTYFDVGAIKSTVQNTLEYDENVVDTSNAGRLAKQIRNMRISGGFTLIDLNPEGIEKMGNGMFTRTVTAAAASLTVDDQVISQGDFALDENVAISAIDSGVALVIDPSTAPTFTSITGSVTGALVVNTDYFLVVDDNSPSGWSLMFPTSGSATAAEDITVDFNSVTPVANVTLSAGQSTLEMTAYIMRITHTDDASAVDRQITLYAVEANSGGFQFNWKGADEDGVEEMPITFTARLDTSRTSGSQLMAYVVNPAA